MVRWEYKVEDLRYYDSGAEGTCDDLGVDGWELVTVDQGYGFFKRPLDEREG